MRASYFILFVIFIAALSSCKKIQENKIINGKWQVIKVELNGDSANAMEVFLQGYKTNAVCCRYIVNFRDDNTCSATYYRNDSIIYSVEGEWELKKFNLVYVKLDRYVNALLDIDRHSRTYYTLHSDENEVEALNQTVPSKLKIKRID